MGFMTRRLILASIFGPLLCLFIWTVWVVNEFNIPAPYFADLKRAAGMAFSAPNLMTITDVSMYIGMGLTLFVLLIQYFMASPHVQKSSYVRGSQLADIGVLKRMTNENTFRNRVTRVHLLIQFSPKRPSFAKMFKVFMQNRKQVSMGGVPFPLEAEPLHTLVAGSTGAGKTQVIRELMKGAVARGDRLVVCDPNGDYLSMFGGPNDVVLNPFDARAPGWSIFNEVRDTYDCERYARSIVPDGVGDLREWNGYAQTLIREIMRKLYNEGCRETLVLTTFVCEMADDNLGAFMRDTPASGFFSGSGDKTLGSTRFIATRFVGPHRHLQPGSFSIREWMIHGDGNLFITWRQDMADALKPLITTWFDVMITATLSMPVDGEPRPLWFICDELASMEKLSSLEDGLTKGRKHGARFVCGIQSTAQLDDIYGKEKAITLRSCFRNVAYLNIPNTDPQTAEELSKGIGDTEYVRKEISKSTAFTGGSRTAAQRNVTERLILPSQIMDLPNLTGYLCYAGRYPVARFKQKPIVLPKKMPGFVAAPTDRRKQTLEDILDAVGQKVPLLNGEALDGEVTAALENEANFDALEAGEMSTPAIEDDSMRSS